MLVALTAAGIFLFKKPVTFSYAGTTCVRQLTLAPHLVRQTSSSPYQVVFRENVPLMGATIASLESCFVPVAAPEKGDHTVGVSLFGWPVFVKQFVVQVDSPPVARTQDFLSKTLPTTRPVAISLSAADEVYEYALWANDRQVACDHQDRKLSCDITTLGLEQGSEYDVRLERSFNGSGLHIVAEGTFRTLRPLALTEQSVTEGQVLYDKTNAFILTYDKPPVLAEAELRTGDTLAPTDVRLEENRVIVTARDDLARNVSFTLTLKKVEAADGTALDGPYTLSFNTGGGPKVTGVNYGALSSPLSGTIIMTFDQPIANAEKALSLISVQGVTPTVRVTDNRVLVNYQTGLCQPITVAIAKGLENEHGIVQDQPWSFATRTTCYTTQVIGYSKQGRAIIAYLFGTGAKKILFTGALHGNERNTKSLLDAWIGELEARATDIPGGTQVVVIPLLNPDGFAANTRTNSANVDLNRNFDTTDWKKDIDNVYGQPFPGGGGETAMSEPETQAIANYSLQLRPTLTLSYHSVAGYAIANTCGASAARASAYASSSGYRNMTGVSGAFDYEITGTYDDWLCQRLGLASVLIELSTTYSSEFSRNRAAMWLMVRS